MGAHKVVLAACSSYFTAMFGGSPIRSPVCLGMGRAWDLQPVR